MTLRFLGFGGLPDQASHKRRIITPTTILTAVAAAVFAITEIGAVAWATVWGIAGYFHLSMTAELVLAILIAIPSLWAMVAVSVLAFRAETDPENV